MAYMRRIVWFDKKGDKHVTFRSMGDDAPASSSAAAPAGDDCATTCSQTTFGTAAYNACMADCTAKQGAADPVAALTGALARGYDKVVELLGGGPAPSSAAPGAPAAAAASGFPTPVLVGGLALGAYLIFRRKKRGS